ncbi:hypothetical protein P879_03970 [Paragonimus westermani]|uniref:Uncharacterized protein n=1 Tax=Paragonimus westermani TaxID=34504 RepID=A0A8T0CYI9_9TREM|nr:hypothetical protein P879_03970 [Paragonimus westermani]
MNRETSNHRVNGSSNLNVSLDCEMQTSGRQPNPDSFRRYSVSDLSKSPEDLYTPINSDQINKHIIPPAKCGNVHETDDSGKCNQPPFLTNPAFWMFQLLAQYSANPPPVASSTTASSSIGTNYGDGIQDSHVHDGNPPTVRASITPNNIRQDGQAYAAYPWVTEVQTKPVEWSFQLDTSVEFSPQSLAKPFDGSKPEPSDYRAELADSKKLCQHGLYCSNERQPRKHAQLRMHELCASAASGVVDHEGSLPKQSRHDDELETDLSGMQLAFQVDGQITVSANPPGAQMIDRKKSESSQNDKSSEINRDSEGGQHRWIRSTIDTTDFASVPLSPSERGYLLQNIDSAYNVIDFQLTGPSSERGVKQMENKVYMLSDPLCTPDFANPYSGCSLPSDTQQQSTRPASSKKTQMTHKSTVAGSSSPFSQQHFYLQMAELLRNAANVDKLISGWPVFPLVPTALVPSLGFNWPPTQQFLNGRPASDKSCPRGWFSATSTMSAPHQPDSGSTLSSTFM